MAGKSKIKKAAIQAFTRRMGSGDKIDEDTDEIQITEFVTEPATVEVEYGLTINLGNFESAKVSIGVRVPCYAEELDVAAEWASKWVEARVEREIGAIRGASKKGKDGF